VREWDFRFMTGGLHATRQSSESCRNNKVRVTRDSVVLFLDRNLQRWYS
jgi:hypothetical protein